MNEQYQTGLPQTLGVSSTPGYIGGALQANGPSVPPKLTLQEQINSLYEARENLLKRVSMLEMELGNLTSSVNKLFDRIG